MTFCWETHRIPLCRMRASLPFFPGVPFRDLPLQWVRTVFHYDPSRSAFYLYCTSFPHFPSTGTPPRGRWRASGAGQAEFGAAPEVPLPLHLPPLLL